MQSWTQTHPGPQGQGQGAQGAGRLEETRAQSMSRSLPGKERRVLGGRQATHGMRGAWKRWGSGRTGRLLEAVCLCLVQTHMLKLNPKCDGTRRWGLWEVLRS